MIELTVSITNPDSYYIKNYSGITFKIKDNELQNTLYEIGVGGITNEDGTIFYPPHRIYEIKIKKLKQRKK